MGTVFGAVAMVVHPRHGGRAVGRRLDLRQFGGYFWLYIASFAIGLGGVAIAFTFRPPEPPRAPAAEPSRRRVGIILQGVSP